MFYGLLALTAAGSVYVHEKVKLPPQPRPFASDTSRIPSSGAQLSPTDSIEVILRELKTVEEFAEFLEKHATHRNIEGVGEFLSTYRQSPEDFQQKRWTGPCNNFAEFSAQWAYMHQGKPYLITLNPMGGIVEASRKPWHQFTVCRIGEREWIVFNNQSATKFQGTLADYLATNYPEKEIFRLGGAAPFEFTQPNTLAKLWEHAQANTREEDMEIVGLPQRDGHPIRWSEVASAK